MESEIDLFDPLTLNLEELEKEYFTFMWCPHTSIDGANTAKIFSSIIEDLFHFKVYVQIHKGDRPWAVLESNYTFYFLLKKDCAKFSTDWFENGGCILA